MEDCILINRVILIGRLTKKINLKYTDGGTAVGNFILAVDRRFKNKDTGNREADFVNCVIWQKTAETLEKYTDKGSKIGVEGRIQTRNYENKEGQRVYVTEVVVDNFTFLDSKNDTQNSNDPIKNNGDEITVGNDGLPF